ncbi:MAG: helix-turn-helix domain-containing protein [Patescibacteria group bacterium]|jgi:excisionase family DNA binding protein
MNKDFLSTTEVAEMLGISRVAVFNRIKRGEIKADKIGRNFVVRRDQFGGVFKKSLEKDEKEVVDMAVEKVLKEYGETLKLLGNT